MKGGGVLLSCGVSFVCRWLCGNWHVCNRNHTEIIVLVLVGYVSRRDSACCPPLYAYVHLRCTEPQNRVIVWVQGHSGSSREACVASGNSNVFCGLYIQYCLHGFAERSHQYPSVQMRLWCTFNVFLGWFPRPIEGRYLIHLMSCNTVSLCIVAQR